MKKKFSRVIAIVVAVTMVLGGGITAASAGTLSDGVSSLVRVLTGNGISGIVFSSGEVKENIETDDSVKSVLRIGSTVYVQKQSLIDRCDINAD